jgi:MIP family channel proteins
MAEKEVKINTKAVLHEFICMTLFFYIGCGVATTNPTFNPQSTAFAFGMAIMVLVYAIAHTSGGQLNWAVTIGLMVSGDLESLQGCANMLAQLFGGIIGAALLFATLPEDMGKNLGSNEVNRDDGYTAGAAFFAEFVFSFMLVFVVFQTAVEQGAITGSNDSARPVTAPIAIGFSVFLAHLFLIPVTGCSINPPRSFGPALIATIDGQKGLFDDFWIFFVAPMLGGVTAGLLQKFTREDDKEPATSV